jgi:hypothetical protein
MQDKVRPDRHGSQPNPHALNGVAWIRQRGGIREPNGFAKRADSYERIADSSFPKKGPALVENRPTIPDFFGTVGPDFVPNKEKAPRP